MAKEKEEIKKEIEKETPKKKNFNRENKSENEILIDTSKDPKIG